jgi:hypothetical protein
MLYQLSYAHHGRSTHSLGHIPLSVKYDGRTGFSLSVLIRDIAHTQPDRLKPVLLWRGKIF